MHHSGPLPLIFESPEQGFWGKNCQNESQGKPCFKLIRSFKLLEAVVAM